MLRNPFTKAIWDSRRGLTGWTVGILAVAAMYAGTWPSIGDNPSMLNAMKNYPEALKAAFNIQDLTTPAGYLNGSVYGLLLALLMVIFAISGGTRLIAGDEDAGTLDLLLAYPISRTRLALQRFAALAASVAAISALLWLLMTALRGPAKLRGISVGEFAAANLQLALFGIWFAALAFAVGCASGRRALTLGASAGVAVLAYLANTLIPRVHGLGWVRDLSPFDWYLGGDPLQHGLRVGDALLLLTVSAVLVAAGLVLLNRRDVAV